VAVDAAGHLFFTDTYNSRVRRVDAVTGVITTVAGGGGLGFAGVIGDGGPATGATLRLPYGVAVDAAGNLYIADRSANRIRMVAAAGVPEGGPGI
jgi:sugar lactone lactonase YvrE